MTRIENEVQYNWAVAKVETLLSLVEESTPVNDPNSIELKLLSDLVADYSERHFSIGTPTLVETIKLRMYEMGLTQTALADLLNISTSRINDYLSGRSEPTLKVARAMKTKLNISATIILGV